MAEIRLNYEDAYQAVQKFESLAGDIETSIKATRSQLDSLRGSWQGAASNDFDTLYTEYNSGAQQINETLRELSKALRGWTQNVEQFEANAFK